MAATGRQMKLTAFCHPPGHWRMPGAQPTDMDFGEVVQLAHIAERGLFDMLFFQDSAAVAPPSPCRSSLAGMLAGQIALGEHWRKARRRARKP